MCSGKLSLYITGLRIFNTLNKLSLIKLSLSLGLIVWKKVIFMLRVYLNQ